MAGAVLSTAGHAYIRFRDPKWAERGAYLRLSVLCVADARQIGPWALLYSRETQQAIGEPTPQAMLTIPGMGIFNVNEFMNSEIEPWEGPLDPSDKP